MSDLQIHILPRPGCICTLCSEADQEPDTVEVRVEPDLSEFRRVMVQVGQSMAASWGIPAALLGLPLPREKRQQPEREDWTLCRLGSTAWFDEVFEHDNAGHQAEEDQPETPQERALRLRRTRNTGPQHRPRAPRRIDARRTR